MIDSNRCYSGSVVTGRVLFQVKVMKMNEKSRPRPGTNVGCP